jgi:hypothetical protein
MKIIFLLALAVYRQKTAVRVSQEWIKSLYDRGIYNIELPNQFRMDILALDFKEKLDMQNPKMRMKEVNEVSPKTSKQTFSITPVMQISSVLKCNRMKKNFD